MTNLDIKINVKRLSIYSQTSKSYIDDDTMIKLIERYSNYIRSLYLKLIYEEIHSNRYKGNWEPVEERGYIEYIGTTPVDDIYEVMSDALVVEKIGSNFIVRFEPHYRYPGSRKTLLRVLRAIENGTSDFNARPIFSKCVIKLNRHIYDLWRGFLAMRGVI